MVYPTHYRLRYEGVFRDGGTDLEQWSNTINFANETHLDIDEDAFILNHAVPAAETIYAQSYISHLVVVTRITFNEIGPDGRFTDQGQTHELTEEDWSPIVGQSSQNVEPQRALAVSWLTAYRRGPAHRGRIFLPGYTATVGPNLSIGTTPAGQVGTNMTLALGELSEAQGIVPAVLSSIGQGYARPITSVGVGTRVDTIRRRRNRLDENPVITPLS